MTLVAPVSSASGLASPDPAPDGILYVVGGRSITEADLGDFQLRYFPDQAREALGQLVDEALVEVEAARTGVEVGPETVRRRAAAYVDERRRQIRVQHGADAELETLLAERFGRSLAEFLTDAERLARISLLRDRLVRVDQLREERVEIRALTLSGDRAAADAVLAALRAGADPTLLAETNGLRPPAAPPPLSRGEFRSALLRDAVFAAAPGDVLGPFEVRTPDGEARLQIVKLVRRTAASDGAWFEIREEVERGIAEKPVGVDEYLQWRARVIARESVEVRRGARGLVPWLGVGD